MEPSERVPRHCAWEDLNIYLLIPGSEPMTDQREIATYFINQQVLLGLLRVEEMTQGQRHHQKPIPILAVHASGKPGAHYVTC